jgi:hypothetical protein
MGHTASMRMPVYAGAIGERLRFILLAVLVAYVPLICVALLPARLSAEQLAVRHTEGLVHGFLALRTLEGDTLADGELIQVAHGDSVTSRLVFHFKDGSLHDETAVYSQRRSFRLVSDHLVQKGPAFPHPLDVTIDTTSGQVKVLYTDDGKQKVETQRLALPPNLANGITFTLMKNIARDATRTTLSMVAATPKPRLVKLAITSQGEDEFSIAGATLKATHYVVKIEIGGPAGMLAPLLGKQPADTHVWVLGGEAPAFVKSEGPLFLGGPIWRIELTSPVWPKVPAADTKEKDENKH